MSTLDLNLLDKLRCPRTYTPLRLDDSFLISEQGDKYEVVNGIPILVSAQNQDACKDFHEADADKYTHTEQLSGVTGFFYRMYIRQTIDFLRKSSPQSILDIGGGEGALLKDQNCPRIVIDISLKRLMRNNNTEVTRICADGMNLPFRESAFDVVLVIACLEHTPNPEKVIAETFRVLHPGGRAALLIPNDVLMSLGRILLAKWPPRSPGHLFFFKPGTMKKMAERCGFNIQIHKYLPFNQAPFWLNMYEYMEIEKPRI